MKVPNWFVPPTREFVYVGDGVEVDHQWPWIGVILRADPRTGWPLVQSSSDSEAVMAVPPWKLLRKAVDNPLNTNR